MLHTFATKSFCQLYQLYCGRLLNINYLLFPHKGQGQRTIVQKLEQVTSVPQLLLADLLIIFAFFAVAEIPIEIIGEEIIAHPSGNETAAKSKPAQIS